MARSPAKTRTHRWLEEARQAGRLCLTARQILSRCAKCSYRQRLSPVPGTPLVLICGALKRRSARDMPIIMLEHPRPSPPPPRQRSRVMRGRLTSGGACFAASGESAMASMYVAGIYHHGVRSRARLRLHCVRRTGAKKQACKTVASRRFQTALYGALGCGIAWGIIDGVLYC